MATTLKVTCKREECPRPDAMRAFEYEDHWAFVCLTCGAVQILSKDKVGGTRGSGMKADKRRSVVGRGL
jgi:hypothetical protein